MFFFSQKNTEEQNTQGFTETLSQPITQNLTAIFSWNALWYLYAEGVLWVRISAQKGSVKSVSSVRERTPQRSSSVLSLTVGAFYFSQSNTDEQNTQRPTETLSQPITQSVTANVSWKASVISVCRRRSVGSKLCANEICYICEFCERKKYPLWEKRISSMRERTPLREKKNSPPCEKELPKKSWCKEMKSPKTYLKIKAPLPRFKNVPFSIREHAL